MWKENSTSFVKSLIITVVLFFSNKIIYETHRYSILIKIILSNLNLFYIRLVEYNLIQSLKSEFIY